MTRTLNPLIAHRMPKLPRADQKVCWRDPQQAHAWGWVAVFGIGPFDVVRLEDKSGQGSPTGIILQTELGEQEINEIWLALADESENGSSIVEKKQAE